MAKPIQKSLQNYISKMKNNNKASPSPQNQIPTTPPPLRSLSSSSSWNILRGCKHPRTPSFSSGQNDTTTMQDGSDHAAGAATLSDVDRFLYENFKTLYETEEGEDRRIGREIKEENLIEIIPGLPKISRRTGTRIPVPETGRFFVAPPAASSSCYLIEEAARTSLTTCSTAAGEDISSSSTTRISSSTATASTISDSTRRRSDGDHGERDHHHHQLSHDDFITVLTYSPNPHEDFKKSMQEMIDARFQHNGKINWEFLEALLFCYLDLNDKKSHRFILGAFVDLVVALRENQRRVPAKPQSTVPSNSNIGRRMRRNN